MRLGVLLLLILSPYLLAAYAYEDYYIFENNFDSEYNDDSGIVVYDYTEEEYDPTSHCDVVETYHDYQICWTESGYSITNFND